MALSDDEKAALAKLRAQVTPEQLDKLGTALQNLKDNLEDLNSAFPATQEFLAARGLTNVRELDKEGRGALVAHLEETLARLLPTIH